MAKEAVELEKLFARGICLCPHSLGGRLTTRAQDAIRSPLLGMSAFLMGQYVEFVMDHLLSMLHYPAIYKAKNPVRALIRIRKK